MSRRTKPSLLTPPEAAFSGLAPPPEAPVVGRLTYRLDELAAALGVSRRAIERERAARRFPKPDLTVGRMPLWTPATIRQWIEVQARKGVTR